MNDMVGWASALILMVTLLAQIAAQWKSRTASGVSPWLFVGQFAASAGFVIYSALTHSIVFIVTNSLTALVAVLGQVLYFCHRKSTRKASPERTPS